MSEFTLSAGGRVFNIALSGQAQSLLQAIYLAGVVEPPPLCSGLGSCGRCRARFREKEAPPPRPDEQQILGQSALAEGWRLSCRHAPVPGALIELPPEIGPWAAERPGKDAAPGPACALAVDFGTTSLHFAPVNPVNPVNMDKAQEAQTQARVWVNPQMGAGAEVISRIAFALAPGGLETLSALSRAALGRMVQESAGGKARAPRRVTEICLAANTAMTCLLLGKDVEGLARAPYRLDYAGGDYARLPGLPPLWIAPLISPFVGGDLSAGYAYLTRQGAKFPFILADLGTNGEFILALSKDEALVASLPLGPALEGIGMRCGSEARPGVITDFTLSPSGPKALALPGALPGVGLSGSAYIALIRILLRSGLLRPDGRFAEGKAASPLAGRLAGQLRPCPQGQAWELPDYPHLYLAASDLEEMLKIKAAFSLTLKSLLQAASLRFSALSGLYLAGSLGLHTPGSDLEALGFIPPGGSAKSSGIGNSSLAGASLLCVRPELRPGLIEWAARARVLSLTEEPDFQKRFAEEMRFAY